MKVKDLREYIKRRSLSPFTAIVPSDARSIVALIIELFGPCDIKVEVINMDVENQIKS